MPSATSVMTEIPLVREFGQSEIIWTECGSNLSLQKPLEHSSSTDWIQQVNSSTYISSPRQQRNQPQALGTAVLLVVSRIFFIQSTLRCWRSNTASCFHVLDITYANGYCFMAIISLPRFLKFLHRISLPPFPSSFPKVCAGAYHNFYSWDPSCGSLFMVSYWPQEQLLVGHTPVSHSWSLFWPRNCLYCPT